MAKKIPKSPIELEKEVVVSMTPNDAQVLINIINIAVQSRGLEVAESAVVLAKRIQSAILS